MKECTVGHPEKAQANTVKDKWIPEIENILDKDCEIMMSAQPEVVKK